MKREIGKLPIGSYFKWYGSTMFISENNKEDNFVRAMYITSDIPSFVGTFGQWNKRDIVDSTDCNGKSLIRTIDFSIKNGRVRLRTRFNEVGVPVVELLDDESRFVSESDLIKMQEMITELQSG